MCEGTSDRLCTLTMGPGPMDLQARRVDQTVTAFPLYIQANFIKDGEYSHRKHGRSHLSRTQKSLIIKKECKNDRIRRERVFRRDLGNKTVVVLKIKLTTFVPCFYNKFYTCMYLSLFFICIYNSIYTIPCLHACSTECVCASSQSQSLSRAEGWGVNR